MKPKLLLFNVLGQKRPSQGVHKVFTKCSPDLHRSHFNPSESKNLFINFIKI